MRSYLLLPLFLIACGRGADLRLNGHAYDSGALESAESWLQPAFPQTAGCLPSLRIDFLSLDEVRAIAAKDGQVGIVAGYYKADVASVAASSSEIPLWPLRQTRLVHEIAHHLQACAFGMTDPTHEKMPDLWKRVGEWSG